MADLTNNKEGLGDVFPENSVDVQWNDLQPLITPERLRVEHLLGVPLVSGAKDPNTGKYHIVTDSEIKVFINNAVSLAQLESKVDIMPCQYSEKHPFDRVEYQSWGYFQLRHRPVSSIQELTVTTSDETTIYQIPLAWIDTGQLHQGQLSILPLLMSIRDGQAVPLLSGSGGSAFLALFTSNVWVPSFWRIKYITGFKDGLVPGVINQYIATIAAMELLAAIAATFARSTSTSLGIDGVSQSISGPGGELYNNRLEQLASKRKWLMTRIKAQFGQSIVLGNV